MATQPRAVGVEVPHEAREGRALGELPEVVVGVDDQRR